MQPEDLNKIRNKRTTTRDSDSLLVKVAYAHGSLVTRPYNQALLGEALHRSRRQNPTFDQLNPVP
jgi:hypothetical protein